MEMGTLLAGEAPAEVVDLSRPKDATARRILDAAVTETAAQGVERVTTEGIARRAGVNRATVYRRFGDREQLLAAMSLREVRHVTAGIAAAMEAAEDDPTEQFVEGFVAAVRLAEAHPIVARMARLEPARLIEAGVADGGALLAFGSRFVAEGVRHAQRAGAALHVDPDEAGETITRLFAAFVLLPTTHSVDVTSDDSVRAYVRRTLAPMLLGPAAWPDEAPPRTGGTRP